MSRFRRRKCKIRLFARPITNSSPRLSRVERLQVALALDSLCALSLYRSYLNNFTTRDLDTKLLPAKLSLQRANPITTGLSLISPPNHDFTLLTGASHCTRKPFVLQSLGAYTLLESSRLTSRRLQLLLLEGPQPLHHYTSPPTHTPLPP